MKRVITIILAMAMALSVFSVAYAENGEGNKPSVTYPANSPNPNNFDIMAKANVRAFQESAGSVNMTIDIVNNSEYDVILAAVQPSEGCIISASGMIPYLKKHKGRKYNGNACVVRQYGRYSHAYF